jgi:hypothetical protein
VVAISINETGNFYLIFHYENGKQFEITNCTNRKIEIQKNRIKSLSHQGFRNFDHISFFASEKKNLLGISEKIARILLVFHCKMSSNRQSHLDERHIRMVRISLTHSLCFRPFPLFSFIFFCKNGFFQQIAISIRGLIS